MITQYPVLFVHRVLVQCKNIEDNKKISEQIDSIKRKAVSPQISTNPLIFDNVMRTVANGKDAVYFSCAADRCYNIDDIREIIGKFIDKKVISKIWCMSLPVSIFNYDPTIRNYTYAYVKGNRAPIIEHELVIMDAEHGATLNNRAIFQPIIDALLLMDAKLRKKKAA